MCGRFTYRLTWPEIVKLYRLTLDAPARNTQPRYNICPTTTVDAVIERDGKRELVPMRWGPRPVLMVQADQRNEARYVQRACGIGGREADVSWCVQAHSVPDPRLGILRMA